MDIRPVTLTGQAVCLEPLREDHVPDLAEVGLEESIWEHMLYGNINSVEKMRAFVMDILSRQAQGTDLAFAVIHRGSRRAIGCTRYLNIVPADRKLEIGGTWYGLAYQRTAVNTECKYLLLRHAFETLGCVRVQFKTDARNLRSRRAIKRIGATEEGVLRNHMIRHDGSFRDSVFYSILASEWPRVKTVLEGKMRP